RDEVDVHGLAAEQPPEPVTAPGLIVDVTNERVFDAQPPPALLDVLEPGVEDLAHLPPRVDGDEGVAQLVVRRVKRDGEPALEALVGEPVDGGHKTDGGDGDA